MDASYNGLAPSRLQSSYWIHAGILSIDHLGKNVSENLIKRRRFFFKKMHLIISSAKRWLLCLGLGVLNILALGLGHCSNLGNPFDILMSLTAVVLNVHDITMTSYWAWWRLKSPASLCSLKCLCRRRSKKTSKLYVTGLCEGNSPVTGEFPARRGSEPKNVSIWWRHHGKCVLLFHDEKKPAMGDILVC